MLGVGHYSAKMESFKKALNKCSAAGAWTAEEKRLAWSILLNPQVLHSMEDGEKKKRMGEIAATLFALIEKSNLGVVEKSK